MNQQQLIQEIQARIEDEKQAMAKDAPRGTCAAHHRGVIRAYQNVLRLIKSKPESKSGK